MLKLRPRISAQDLAGAAAARRSLQQRKNDPLLLAFLPLSDPADEAGRSELRSSGTLFQVQSSLNRHVMNPALATVQAHVQCGLTEPPTPLRIVKQDQGLSLELQPAVWCPQLFWPAVV